MGNVQSHYDDLLAAHYSWMSGASLGDKVAEQRELLQDLGVAEGAKRLAIDLGSGPGYQSFALAGLGFEEVIAVDMSRALLNELEAARGGQPIRTVLADLSLLPTIVEPGGADAIVCMGDTITHLATRDDVSKLFHEAYDALALRGRLILTFRDLSVDIGGLDRFFPVRADDDRIMICALDYEPGSVVVNDLIHVRGEAGWTLLKSSYRKLRLVPAALAAELQEIGFAVTHDKAVGRLHGIAATK